MNKQIFISSGIESWLNTIEDELRKKEILEDMFEGDFTDFLGQDLKRYDFQEGIGLCGILLPTGHFLKCKDRQHSLLSSILTTEEQFYSIFFSSKLFKEDNSIFSHYLHNNRSKYDDNFHRDKFVCKLENPSSYDNKIIITEEQVEFLESHYKFLNEYQKIMISGSMLDSLDVPEEFKAENVDKKHYAILPEGSLS